MVIGVISDTHGILTSGAKQVLKSVDHIFHVGDIDRPAVLRELSRIAPINAVRGNMDQGRWADKLPANDLVAFKGVHFYLLHNLDRLDLDPCAAGIQVVISGHTHQAVTQTIQGVLYFNPGSASFGRHGSPPSVGRIAVSAGRVTPQIIVLDD